ncbi:glutathione S-transferase C-terminal-like protein [Boletus reticuloceps]|uniref:Glutathione S-transferase C-terminal-like protein n=1 Tax=Boletus reticuloceps TaxID=495285 RepID=A0A8I3ABM2_9AGAM|nr:glutathione S-transferase C-terminal-like protein [Boletus reticuloceps]
MPPVGTLWGKRHQPQTKIILSVAALNNLELEEPEWHFFKRPGEYNSKFTYNKIPTFEDSDGFRLMEGATIARYLCGLGTKVNLSGSDAKEIAIVDQWVHFVEHEIGKWGYNYMCTVYGIYGSLNREFLDKQVERLFRSLDYVEAHFATRPSGYLVSDSVTLADLVLAGAIYDVSLTALGATERAKYPLVFGHYVKVTGNEKVKQFWEMENFTEVAITELTPFPYS